MVTLEKGTIVSVRNLVPVERMEEAVIAHHVNPITGHRKGSRGSHKEFAINYAGLIMSDFKHVYTDCPHCVAVRGAKIARSSKNIAKVQRVEAKSSECQIDLIDMRGNPSGAYHWVLVYINTRTKRMRMVALKGKTAHETVMEFYKVWVADGGTCIIRSDRGGEFVNRLMALLGAAFGVKVEPNNQANNPNATGAIERSNIWTKQMLFSLMHRMHTTKWHLLLPIAELGVNNRYKRGINMSPQLYALGERIFFALWPH